MLATKTAVLAELKPFGLGLFVFGRRIVPLLAFVAGEGNDITHIRFLYPRPSAGGRGNSPI
jgi:hypothetical protein